MQVLHLGNLTTLVAIMHDTFRKMNFVEMFFLTCCFCIL